MTCETLQQLHEDGLLTVEDLQRLFAWSRSTAYRRLAGDVSLTLDEALVICRNSSAAVALAFCRTLTAGVGIDHVHLEADADVDGDGDIDTDDLLASAAETGDAFADSLRHAIDASGDGRLSHVEAEALIERCHRVRTAAAATERIVGLIRRAPRKRARRTHGHSNRGGGGMSEQPTGNSQRRIVAVTAEGHPIAEGLMVWAWDDVPEVPRLDMYHVTDVGANPDYPSITPSRTRFALTGVPSGRLHHSLAAQLWSLQLLALTDGCAAMLAALSEHGEEAGRLHRVCWRGVHVTLNGEGAWYGDRWATAYNVDTWVRPGWHFPPSRGEVAVYDEAGKFLAILERNEDQT